MKTLHYNMMRPEFLLGLMGGNVGELTMDSMKKTLEDTTPLCYVTYTVLMEANIDKADVERMYNDGESIAVTFKSKKMAQEVKDICNKEIVRYGSHHYRARLKVRSQHLICEAECIDEVDEAE